MKNLIIGLIFTGLTSIGFAQDKSNEIEITLEESEFEIALGKVDIALEEVEVIGINNKYLNAIGHKNAAEPVKLLTQKVASFDLEYSNCLKADYEEQEYYVQFKIPQGEISVVYDSEGQIIRTSEKFKDISLPLAVSNAIVDRYPGWKISRDIYQVIYVKDGELNKTYKLFIEKTNIGKRVIKTDENGKFI